MDEMIAYIFRGLRMSEVTTEHILRTIKKQAGFNRSMTNFAFMATACIILSEMNAIRQQKKIKELSDKIEEIKRSKGE